MLTKSKALTIAASTAVIVNAYYIISEINWIDTLYFTLTHYWRKIDYILSDVVIKVAENKPGAEEKIRSFDKDIFPKITDDFEW